MNFSSWLHGSGTSFETWPLSSITCTDQILIQDLIRTRFLIVKSINIQWKCWRTLHLKITRCIKNWLQDCPHTISISRKYEAMGVWPNSSKKSSKNLATAMIIVTSCTSVAVIFSSTLSTKGTWKSSWGSCVRRTNGSSISWFRWDHSRMKKSLRNTLFLIPRPTIWLTQWELLLSKKCTQHSAILNRSMIITRPCT